MILTPAALSGAVLRSVRDALTDGELGDAVRVPERAPLRPAPRGGGGRWATGIALRLAGPAGRSADEVARVLGARLMRQDGVRDVEVSGGGFLTITLGDGADAALLREILARPRPPALPDDPARDVERWRAAGGGEGNVASLLVQREENPLFLVRYAHARSRALVRGAAALGFAPEERGDVRRDDAQRRGIGAGAGGERRGGIDAYPFPYPGERALLGLLGEVSGMPRGRGNAPGRLRQVADALLTAERERPTLPVGDEKPGVVHRARLALAQAAGAVLADGLHQWGISAPDHL
ncbi:DALR anticodon-binding domain-containing protein [Streptomyces sp. 4N509B]|uniref:DALR anticodon-binding domain-containing protein n=1 Tax=Streptomyces sp. 4N509B TaxID=3457413 RepID=UPI003FD27114